MNVIDQLKAVLCDPEGKCCVAGSDEDRAIVDRALEALAQPEQEPVGEVLNERGEVDYISYVPPAGTALYTSPPKRQLESTTDMMMELADRLGGLPDDIDPRAWGHLLVYAPKKQWVGLTEWEREAIAVECGAMSADWLVFMEAVERALKEKNS